MLNFANLSDVEFEYLCTDVMSKMLGIRLQRFGPGRDGGVDLTDDAVQKNIVVQVKHYIKTDASTMIRKLEQELLKVDRIHPAQYYICCSKELTPNNKCEIFQMFSNYMVSTNNIITAIELNDFLEKEENTDILRKHYKLWVESTNILSNMYTNDIFIDCEALFSNIEDEKKLYVKTKAFDKAIACLEKRNVLIIVGNPGVGKTITSKMLVLHYAANGYKVRYTTDGADVSSLKRSLSADRDLKEVILLDDCFGQAYFSMKSTQETELLALIRYVQTNTNKILIMNSRVTIYSEAKERTPELVRSFDRKEYKVHILDVANLSLVEKAKILYNHLYFFSVDDEFWNVLKQNRNYNRIIEHHNYNPRIIEYICNQIKLHNITSSDYMNFVIDSLNNPQEAWKNEYERRLQNVDRLLLTTVYSLSNTMVSLELVRKCFNYRIGKIPGVDLSINQFNQALARLNESFVVITDRMGMKMLSIANPSINDFINAYLSINIPYKNELICSSKNINQFKRLLDENMYDKHLQSAFSDKSILDYYFVTEYQKAAFVTEYVSRNKIFDDDFKSLVDYYMTEIGDVNIDEKETIWAINILEHALQNDFCIFYGIDKVVKNLSKMYDILQGMEMEDVVLYIEFVDWIMQGDIRSQFVASMLDLLNDMIFDRYSEIQVGNYDIDVGKYVDNRMYEDEDGGHIDTDGVEKDIETDVIEKVEKEINNMLNTLPDDIYIETNLWQTLKPTVVGVDKLVTNYLLEDWEYSGYEYEKEFHYPEIDYMFDR